MDNITISDWVLISTTFVLACVAFVAPYVIERWKYKFYSAKLNFKFIHKPPFCHITQMRGAGVDHPAYYFRFKVVNTGKVQAELCEAVIERIWKENSGGEFKEYIRYSPTSLKWSGTRAEKYFTIQPGREYFCDIGRIHHPDNEPESVYRDITEEEKNQNKFFFEFPERFYAQWDCLSPGKYKIEIAVYSKNANKISKEFKISWSGNWNNNEEEMLDELVIM